MKSLFYLLSTLVAASLLLPLPTALAFSPSVAPSSLTKNSQRDTTKLFKISQKRRDELGIGEGEDEYDLGKALENNTDPLISKIVAGSFILVMVSLLVFGVVIPYTTDYGEGVCNPLLTAGRC